MPHDSSKSTNLVGWLFGIGFFLFSLATTGALTMQNDGKWQRIAVDDLFSFQLPQGFVKGSRTDERGEYYKDDTKLVFVWGNSESGPFEKRRQAWMNDYHETTTRLGGRRALIRTYSQAKHGYVAELNVGNWDKGEVQLYMRVEGNDQSTLELANQIFKSVTFPIPPPPKN